MTFGKISTSDVTTNGPQTSVAGKRYCVLDRSWPSLSTLPDSSSVPDVVDEFKSTRRVRAVPGGSHTDIFAHEDEDDALSTAPPKTSLPQVGITMLTYHEFGSS